MKNAIQSRLGFTTEVSYRSGFSLTSNGGFTLIELLVVVLIIGILAAVALPQYQKAVEKAHLAEFLQNIKIIKDQAALYILENGYPAQGQGVDFIDLNTSVELQGGKWEENYYYATPYYRYGCGITSEGLYCEIYQQQDKYAFAISSEKDSCFTFDNSLGEYICKQMESKGFVTQEGEL